jgi:hypothetical protein
VKPDSFPHSLGLVLVRLGSLAPIPIGEGGLGGTTGDGEQGGGDADTGAGARTAGTTVGSAGGPISPPLSRDSSELDSSSESESSECHGM